MPMNITINSRTDGKFTQEMINNRSHIVTKMMPIRGDIAMNGLFYSNKEVTASFMQLDMLPAPNGHPVINGVHVPAFHPVANNAQNVGGFIRKPKKVGKEVFVDFVIDEQIANQSKDGIEILNRIKKGEKVGVSTGLSIDQVINKNGTDDFGAKFNKEGMGFNFDHVAILLNEEAAGEHAGTELVLNTDKEGEPIFVVNMALTNNELSDNDVRNKLHELISGNSDHVDMWVSEVFTESKTFIMRDGDKLFKQGFAIENDEISLVGDRVEVEVEFKEVTTVTTNQKEDLQMDLEKLVLMIIANSNNAFNGDDKDKLMKMSESDLVSSLCVSVDDTKAKEVLTNAGFDFAGYDNFVANKADFDSFKAAEKVKLDDLKKDIVSNSEFTDELLANKSEAELLVINKLITGETKPTLRLPEGKAPATNSAANTTLDYSM